MRSSRVTLAVVASLVLVGCGDSGGGEREAFALPVGSTTWDVTAPAWYLDGTLHVGERTVELGDRVDQFVLGATGAYWMRGGTLMFTSAAGRTEEVADVGWGNLAVSADRSVFATVDQSQGPADRYGTNVIQLAVFDTRTGEQLFRTDEKPDPGDDLADLYGEIMPLLHGVSDEYAFFDGTTVDLATGNATESARDADGFDVYQGYADTLFSDGYHVSLRGDGDRRELTTPSMDAVGRLSPDRSTIFDVGTWPTPAVVYDAETGRQRPIDAPGDHFSLGGWTDEDTFFGVAQRIDESAPNPVRSQQVVTCALRTLACSPVSPVVPSSEPARYPTFLVEGPDGQL